LAWPDIEASDTMAVKPLLGQASRPGHVGPVTAPRRGPRPSASGIDLEFRRRLWALSLKPRASTAEKGHQLEPVGPVSSTPSRAPCQGGSRSQHISLPLRVAVLDQQGGTGLRACRGGLRSRALAIRSGLAWRSFSPAGNAAGSSSSNLSNVSRV